MIINLCPIRKWDAVIPPPRDKNVNILNGSECRKNECNYVFKLLIVGDSGVGKSSLLLRFSNDIFSEEFVSTIGFDLKIKILPIEESIVKLQMWDTSGQERFKTITKSYYRDVNGVIIAYDVTDEQSFKNVKMWEKEINPYLEEKVQIILVGNKSDLEDKRADRPRKVKKWPNV